MADDVNVKEIDLLKTYSAKLIDFQSCSLPIAVLICAQVGKIKEDLERDLNEVKRLKIVSEEHSKKLVQKYKAVIDDVGENAREVIGSSDLEVMRIRDSIAMRCDEVEDKIKRLQMLLDNAFQHTKNFELQITNMIDSCRANLNNQIQLLEEYKNQHL